jgi:hypothetical protein
MYRISRRAHRARRLDRAQRTGGCIRTTPSRLVKGMGAKGSLRAPKRWPCRRSRNARGNRPASRQEPGEAQSTARRNHGAPSWRRRRGAGPVAIRFIARAITPPGRPFAASTRASSSLTRRDVCNPDELIANPARSWRKSLDRPRLMDGIGCRPDHRESMLSNCSPTGCATIRSSGNARCRSSARKPPFPHVRVTPRMTA